MQYFLIFSATALIVCFGTGTYIRNMAWATEKTLWEDAIQKAPNTSRAYHNLAWGYYQQIGQYDKALELYQHALRLNDDTIASKSIIYYNIAVIYEHLKKYDETIEYARKAIDAYPLYFQPYYLLSFMLGKLGRYDDALKPLNYILYSDPNEERYLQLKGLILLHLSKPDEALGYFGRCLNFSPTNWRYLQSIGIAFNQMDDYEKGYWFLKRALFLHSQSPDTLLALAENRVKAGAMSQAEYFITRFMDVIRGTHVERYFIGLSQEKMNLPITYKILAPLVAREIQRRSTANMDTAATISNYFHTN